MYLHVHPRTLKYFPNQDSWHYLYFLTRAQFFSPPPSPPWEKNTARGGKKVKMKLELPWAYLRCVTVQGYFRIVKTI